MLQHVLSVGPWMSKEKSNNKIAKKEATSLDIIYTNVRKHPWIFTEIIILKGSRKMAFFR